jgi:hypothetical protein
MQSATPPLP